MLQQFSFVHKSAMKQFHSVLLITILTSISLLAQDTPETRPTVQDLDFYVGTWEITFQIYDTHNPGQEALFTEKGTQVCEYDLSYRGVPQYIICKGQVVCDSRRYEGRTRSFQEAIRYGQFEDTYERVGIYSNWPATGLELLRYDSANARFIIKGELKVQDHMLERYEDIYQFNEDYSVYNRRNVANFSDMPITEYNLTLTGTGRKVK